jgi:ketosteroid isomerase-like protein
VNDTLETRARTAEEVGRSFVDALARRDWASLERCFAPDVQFQAVVPNAARPFRDKPDASSAVEQIRKWFSDADPLVLAHSEVGMIADRLAIRYRFTGHEPDGDFVVEQDAFAEVDGGRVTSMRLVCSGFIYATPRDGDRLQVAPT